jgi:hypothetical protein
MSRSISAGVAGLLLLAAGTATAATFNVGNAADIKDAIPGDGKCSFIPNHPVPNDPGVCTLRAAVMEANATPAHDTIVLTSGATYLLTLPGRDEDNAASGDLDIRQPVTIRPPLFWGIPVGLSTIHANGLDRVFDINGVSEGVTMVGLVLRGGDYGGDVNKKGAGIQLLNARADFSFMDIDTQLGTGVYVLGQLTDVRVTHSTISASAGWTAFTTDFHALATIERSSLINSGQGVFVRSNAILTISDSTISGNSSLGVQALFSGEAYVSNSTIAGNASSGVSVSGEGSTVTVTGSVFAGNVKSCEHVNGDAALVMTRNVFDDDTCPNSGAANTTLYNVPVFLSLLGDHGGWTPTHRPMVNSPALDRLTGADCTADKYDQRLMPRAVDFRGEGPKCDAGAVELETDVIFFDQVDRL